MQIAILSFFHYFTLMFKKRENVFEVEEGKFLSPKFDAEGVIPVTPTDSSTGELLMHGYMNQEALKKTIETKEAHYWSRSRKALWQKGKTSGFVQKVIELRIDDNKLNSLLKKINALCFCENFICFIAPAFLDLYAYSFICN